ncbi:MAG: hypothetical protein WCG42_00780 [Parachlamydiaceae bacterium]
MKFPIFSNTTIALTLLTVPIAVVAMYTSQISGTEQIAVHPNKKELLKIINDFLIAIRADKLEDAYNLYTSTQFRQGTSLADLKSLAAAIMPLSSNKLFQYHSFYVDGNIAIFQGDLIATNESVIPVEYDLVQENGQWKIMGLQLYQIQKSNPQSP